MRYLLFNVVVACALVYLFAGAPGLSSRSGDPAAGSASPTIAETAPGEGGRQAAQPAETAALARLAALESLIDARRTEVERLDAEATALAGRLAEIGRAVADAEAQAAEVQAAEIQAAEARAADVRAADVQAAVVRAPSADTPRAEAAGATVEPDRPVAIRPEPEIHPGIDPVVQHDAGPLRLGPRAPARVMPGTEPDSGIDPEPARHVAAAQSPDSVPGTVEPEDMSLDPRGGGRVDGPVAPPARAEAETSADAVARVAQPADAELEPALERRRAEVLAVGPVAPGGAGSRQAAAMLEGADAPRFAVAEGQTLMAAADRRRELQLLAEDMEMTFIRLLGR